MKKRRLEFTELVDNVQPLTEADPSVPDGILNVQAIQKAIKELPDGYRIVFTLYALEGYDHEEIGDILGVTEATSKSQYSRAKTKLRHILQSPQQLMIND